MIKQHHIIMYFERPEYTLDAGNIHLLLFRVQVTHSLPISIFPNIVILSYYGNIQCNCFGIAKVLLKPIDVIVKSCGTST